MQCLSADQNLANRPPKSTHSRFLSGSDTSGDVIALSAKESSSPVMVMHGYHPQDEGRSNVEAFIAAVFREQHDALLSSFMPTLLADGDCHHDISCAVGIRYLHNEPLFLEQYLEAPIETMLSKLDGDVVSRQQVAEVGNLASTSAGSCRKLFTLLVHYLARQQTQWVVCTGTSVVRAVLSRVGIDHALLKRAKPEQLNEDRFNWGTYYRHNPMVLAIHIPSAREKLSDDYQVSLGVHP